MKSVAIVVLAGLLTSEAAGAARDGVAVVHYDVRLRLDFDAGSVSGDVDLTLRSRGAGSDAVTLDVGDLTIDSVSAGRRRLLFKSSDRRLEIRLPGRLEGGVSELLSIAYHGRPARGLRFIADRQQAYTVFSTSQWMPSIDAPEEKATLRLRLCVPSGLDAVGSGERVGQRDMPEGRVEHEWRLETPLPTYVFGFAVGPFRSVAETHGRVRLEYWGTEFTDDELRRAFTETRPMLDFFEERAGVPYPGRTYTQVLAAGRVEQEVGHFTLLGESYGRRLLDDPKDLWLMAHELAHQWWGNGVTCVDWTHFWLNEGMATFLAAAYRETRLGRAAYLKEIEEVRLAYEGVRERGADKPLVFADWLKPTADDRVIVYSKGAYVLHLLRESLGDALFWEGLRSYTRKHMGGSVTTADFQKAMEDSTRRDLSGFFRQWVYSVDAGSGGEPRQR